jgi:hypothetical protein
LGSGEWIWGRLRDSLILLKPLVTILGVPGLMLALLVLLNIMRQRFHLLTSPYLMLLGGLFVAYVVLIRHGEIMRHSAILLSVMTMISIVLLLPSSRALAASTTLKATIVLCAFLAMLSHGYYVYAFTQKPSVLEREIPWRDYFCMNDIIKVRYPNTPTLAANGGGTRLPIVMEVASSFTSKEDAFVHSQISNLATLDKLDNKNVLPIHVSKELGVRMVVWGPLEERAWGERSRHEYLKDKNLIEQCGVVSLYRLE